MSVFQKILIADAGPLIALTKIQQLKLLPELFSKVIITDLISDELGITNKKSSFQFDGSDALIDAIQANWLKINVDQSTSKRHYYPTNPGVDPGEASAISLAISMQEANLELAILIDDRCGRAEARQQNIEVIGTAGLLLIAKEYALINKCVPLLIEMQNKGYYLSNKLINLIAIKANG